jgi:hypothetical protein
MDDKNELLKKASQPVRAMTNVNGVISSYLRIVEQLMAERGQNSDRKKSA